MMDWDPVYRVATLGFAVGIVFGAVVHKTNFCTMGAVSDWINIGSKDRLRAWFLAIGVAILASQFMQHRGMIDLGEAIYLTPNFGWLGHIVGGFLFGVGMTLGSGCGQRTLVRVGGGNLKSLVVLLFLGITAYMTMRGLLALVRVNLFDSVSIDLAGAGVANQGIGTLIAAALGTDNVEVVSRVKKGPSRSTPSLIALSLSPNFPCTQSRSRNRDARKARVAPIVLAKETVIRATQNPNNAPPARVMTAAPGRDSAVTTM